MSVTSHGESKTRGILSLPLVRDLLVIGLLIVIVWKLLSAEVKIDLASFSFNDFLALTLALFSVALSVAFYFKANEASNQFYDNTYKFTKDMSEILGRIEAGFGERLRHLDEGYSGVRERLDKMPNYVAVASEVKREEEVIQRKEQEQRALIEELANKAKLAEHEKTELFSNLEEKHQELEQARAELRIMRKNQSMHSEPNYVIEYIVDILHKKHPKVSEDELTPRAEIARLFNMNRHLFANQAIRDMEKYGLIDNAGELTRHALNLLSREWHKR